MLTSCPECGLQVSDKAASCPHCGYPLSGEEKNKRPRKAKRRRRLPNGFGQISEIKNRNLRKPFRAMVTVGKNEVGRPICKPLKPDAYFETYNEAYAALVEYNRNPYDLNPGITMQELFDKWIAFREEKEKDVKWINIGWSYCSAVYDMRVLDVRARHIKGCIDEGTATFRGKEQTATPLQKKKIKSIFNLLLDYAVEYELVDKNYARTFALDGEVAKQANTIKQRHITYSDDEMNILWQNLDSKKCVDVILIQCYSGWRPAELLSMKMENINLEEWTMTGGMKTQNGKNRVVPIHTRIKPLVEKRYQEAKNLGSKYLFNYEGSDGYKPMSYKHLSTVFRNLKHELGLNPKHRPHDGRVRFVTSAKNSGVDEYAIKYLVGHAITDLTERVYTQREIDWLRAEIGKIL